MSEITKPIALDETLQRIATVLENQNNGTWRTGIRNQSLGSSFTPAQQEALRNDDMSEFWNGDFWEINNIHWRIVDNTGVARKKNGFDSPSLIIMPDENIIAAEAFLIDNANDSGHGYKDCAYRTRTDGKGRAACRTIVNNAFGSSHVAAHHELLSTSRAASGAQSWAWTASTDTNGDADVELPSEANIYGHGVFGLSKDGGAGGYNEGINWGQFMLFRLDPSRAINGTNYWLRDVVSASGFAIVDGHGHANDNAPSHAAVGLRPYFILIG